MLKKITGIYARSEEMADFIREADEMIVKYGWYDCVPVRMGDESHAGC